MLRQIAQSTVHSQQSTVKKIFLSLLSAFLLILSFPNFNLWILSWFGFVPLFFALENKPPHQLRTIDDLYCNWCGGKSKIKAFLLAYLTGIIFWAGTIYWLVHVTLLGTILLIIYLALYFGLFGLIIRSYGLLFIPSLWVILEYIRSHLLTGFPWALLGYSQYLNLPIIQIADITGAWGVSFLVMLVNATVYAGLRAKGLGLSKKQISSGLFCLILVLGYGFYKLNQPVARPKNSIKVSVIQGNIRQELKWKSESEEYIMSKYLNLTHSSLKDKPDLVLWPEAALPIVLEKEVKFPEIKTPLLIGAVTKRGSFYYNSAILLSRDGQTKANYDKLHLVPFGEYVPLKNIFPFLETIVPIGDIHRGSDYTVFSLDKEKFSVLICFEDLFPELSREFVRRGAGFLVNITNDAWYKESSAPYQHLQASVFRAVENRVYLVRAANTGVSAFISPQGSLISLPASIDGYQMQEIGVRGAGETFYSHFGDIFIIFCLLSVLYVIILTQR